MSEIFLEIKFSHRHDSPGCLEVKNLNINIFKDTISLNAECILGDIPIRFVLNFKCLYEFNDNQSNANSGSVGRFQLTLKKKEEKYWSRLLKNEEDTPTNLRTWFEMKNKYDGEMKQYYKNNEIDDKDKSFEDIANEIKKEIKKDKKKKKKKNKKSKEKKNGNKGDL